MNHTALINNSQGDYCSATTVSHHFNLEWVISGAGRGEWALREELRETWRVLTQSQSWHSRSGFQATIFILIASLSVQNDICTCSADQRILGRPKLIQPKREQSLKLPGGQSDSSGSPLQSLFYQMTPLVRKERKTKTVLELFYSSGQSKRMHHLTLNNKSSISEVSARRIKAVVAPREKS